MFGQVSVTHLIAWVEMNRLMGVQHFMFYVFAMNPAWVKLLTFYQAKGIVQIIEWNTKDVPTSKSPVWPPPPTKLHYFGQFPSYNDCLYRVGNRFRFLMFTDIDEMIVPSNGSLANYLNIIDEDQLAEFRFRNTYVSDVYPAEELIASLAPDLATEKVPFLTLTRRENRVLSPDTGAKAIVKFQTSLVMGVHGLLRAANFSLVAREVPQDEALLFHYRAPPRNLAIKDSGQRSEALVRLLRPLVRAVRKVQRELGLRPSETADSSP